MPSAALSAIPRRLFVHLDFVELLSAGFANASERASFLGAWIREQRVVLRWTMGAVLAVCQVAVFAVARFVAELEASNLIAENARGLAVPSAVVLCEAIALIAASALFHVGIANLERSKIIAAHLEARDRRLADALAVTQPTLLYLRDFAGDSREGEGAQPAGYTRRLSYRTSRVLEKWVQGLGGEFGILEFFNAAETVTAVSKTPIAVVGEKDWRDSVTQVLRSVSIVIVHLRHGREGVSWELMTAVAHKPTLLIASVNERSHVEGLLAGQPSVRPPIQIYYENDLQVLDADKNPDTEKAILEMSIRVRMNAGETSALNRAGFRELVRELASAGEGARP